MWSVNLSDADAPANWLAYPATQNAVIEAAHRKGAKAQALKGTPYFIDLIQKRQVRKDNEDRWRPVRREEPVDDDAMPAAAAAAPAAAPARKGAAAKKRRVADDEPAAAAAVSSSSAAHPSKKPHSAAAGSASSSSAAAAAASARPPARSPTLSGLAAVELLSVFAFLDSVEICLLGRVSRAAQAVMPRAWKHTLLRLDSVHPLASMTCPRLLTQKHNPARVALRWRSPRLVPGLMNTEEEDEPPAAERIDALFAMPILPYIVDLDASAAGEDLAQEDWERLFTHAVLAGNLKAFRGFEGEDGDAPTSLLDSIAENMPNLTCLNFRPDSDDANQEHWMSLARLPNLTRLATQDEQLTLAALDACTALRHFDLYGPAGPALEFRAFHASETAARLESLAWRWMHCGAPVPAAAPAAAAAAAAVSDGFAPAAAAKPPTAAEYLRAFSALRSLRVLELDHAFGIDAWARHLSRIPRLQRLIIRPDVPYAPPQLDAEGKPKANDTAPSAAVLAKLMTACPDLEVCILFESRPIPGDTISLPDIERVAKLVEELKDRYAGHAVLVPPRFRIKNTLPAQAEAEAAAGAAAGADKEEGEGEEED